MRIAHLTTADISLWFLLLPQLTAVVRRGGTAVGISAPGMYVPALRSAGIQHIALQHSTRGQDLIADVRTIAELWRALRRLRPDVLHTHNPKPGIYGRIVGRLTGVPVVLNTTHGLYASPDDRFAKKAIVYTLEAVASRFSDYELVQSIEDYELLTRLRITRPDRTILLGNGIDVDRFNPERFDESERISIREELGIGDDQFVTGIVARVVRGKGFVELTEAAECLDARHVIIAIGPDDPDKSDALTAHERARAEAAGIRFLGHRDDVDRLYAAMDAFVLPSHREGFPRAAMEAAAMGLAIAASNIRGCRQAVDDGVTGILFPLQSADDIATSLALLANDPSLCRDMGAAARRKALDEFDERSVVDTVLRTQVAALREKGRFERLETDTDAEFTVRWAIEEDLPILASICALVTGGTRADGSATVRSRRRCRSHVGLQIADLAVAADRFGPVGFAVRTDAVGPHDSRFGRLRMPWWPRSDRNHLSSHTVVPSHDLARNTPILIAEPFRGLGLEARLHDWVREHGNR